MHLKVPKYVISSKQTNGPDLSVATIWRVLKRHNAKSIKKYRRHKDFKRYNRPVPGDRVQIDVTKVTRGYDLKHTHQLQLFFLI